MKNIKDKIFQEVFVKLKFSPEAEIDSIVQINYHKRNFAWRYMNANKLWTKDISIDPEKRELSFTSEFNIEFSKEQIAEIMNKDTYFSVGEGIRLKPIKMELIEIKEEKEIYELD